MERYGFWATVAAGFLSCCLLAWQGFSGAAADWVPGFLCVLWSLLMLARLMVLTAPNTVTPKSHLAQKIIHALHQEQENRRGLILQQSFNLSFAVFVIIGFLLCVWQLGFTLYRAAPDSSIAAFFAANGQNPWLSTAAVFDWGRAFLYLLCTSMMGFLLRSYASDKTRVRQMLLIFTGYIAAGLVLFFGLSQNWALPETIAFLGYEGAAQSTLLLDVMVAQTGFLGLTLLAAMFSLPVFFMWWSLDRSQKDWLVVVCGTVAFLGLAGSLFVGAHPALGGFAFLCAMGIFLAWGASEQSAAAEIR